MKTKEQTYDELIEPLMNQIIAICKERNIAFIASFGLDGETLCTSTFLEETCNPLPALIKAKSAIFGGLACSFAVSIQEIVAAVGESVEAGSSGPGRGRQGH